MGGAPRGVTRLFNTREALSSCFIAAHKISRQAPPPFHRWEQQVSELLCPQSPACLPPGPSLSVAGLAAHPAGSGSRVGNGATRAHRRAWAGNTDVDVTTPRETGVSSRGGGWHLGRALPCDSRSPAQGWSPPSAWHSGGSSHSHPQGRGARIQAPGTPPAALALGALLGLSMGPWLGAPCMMLPHC